MGRFMLIGHCQQSKNLPYPPAEGKIRPEPERHNRMSQTLAVQPVAESDITRATKNLPQHPVGRLKSIRQSHHLVAKQIALGMRNMDIAASTGYAPGTITSLKQDPTFKALIKYYRKHANVNFGLLTKQLALLSRDTLQILRERMESNPDEIKISELLDILKVSSQGSGEIAATKHEHTVSGSISNATELINAVKEEVNHAKGRTPQELSKVPDAELVEELPPTGLKSNGAGVREKDGKEANNNLSAGDTEQQSVVPLHRPERNGVGESRPLPDTERRNPFDRM